jgi:Transglutaminase-like superfamily.
MILQYKPKQSLSMVKNIWRISILLAVIFNVYNAKAEEIKKERYGKVSMEEMTMTQYEKDTSADAVVLYSLGEFDPTHFKFSQFIRVKILRTTGTNQANMAFFGKLKNLIRGCTYNIENGNIVKSPLKSESVFEERLVNDVYQTRIALPNVKVGSVIEVEVTQDGVPLSFEFQKDIPVAYAALDFTQNDNISIKIQQFGLLGFSFHDQSSWIAKDLPAFKKEPFMLSTNDYKLRFEFELLSVTFPWFTKSFCTNWDMATSMYLDNPDFGSLLNNANLCVNDFADSIKASSTNDKEKLQFAYNLIQKKIKWNNQDACFGSQTLKKTMDTKSGNSADINFLFIEMLRKAGITVNPILFSTRDNGRISPFSPTIRKFNYMIAGATVEGKTYYLDASQEYLPFGMIPEKLLGCNGHEVSNKALTPPCSITLKPTLKDKVTTSTNLQMDSTGSIIGKISIIREDYNAIDFKNMLKEYTDQDAYIEKLEAQNTSVHINSFNCSNVNNLDEPLKEEMKITLNNNSANNEVVVINPNFFPDIKDNPFVSEKRNAPISFSEPLEYISIANILLPQNFHIIEIPKSITISSPDKNITLVYNVYANETVVSIRMKFTVDKLNFDLSEYGVVRQLFEMLIQKQSESIVLKKI